ncbi:sigma-B regulation protein RsbU (phosphoserine phosphatase) [Desulfobotulus alkaliphilus]|uniref:Sigma-B regulation protein RsbU (Phosphoserine phosphatase) n=1 Tax=Desulfobotulus alkaliphilus TaxID=622671 RepID=A0A562RVI3_9BACT|nr:SpoIIE family protein phosphatase [Desulfobotulus alkaliphilus]TWI73062.1 sigma-B regulation protein RsbU (phosphoserine phosphatase) [Desulfobotulus alkaliphilus]
MLHSLKTRICILIALVLTLVAVPVLYFTHKDGVQAMSEAEQRSVQNVLELAELNIRSGYRSLLYSRVDAVRAHRQNLESMVAVARKGFDLIFSSTASPAELKKKEGLALDWISGLASVDGTEFLVLNKEGILIAHPDAGIRNSNLNQMEDIKGFPLADAVNDEARRLGTASTTFFWTFGSDGKARKKFGWFVHYPATDWVLGAVADIEALEHEGERKKKEMLDNLKANFETIRIARSGSLILFDRSGEILIPSKNEDPDLLSTLYPETEKPLFEELQLLAATGSREAIPVILPDLQGEMRERVIFCTYFRTLGWYVAAIAYTDEIRAPAQALVQRLSLIIAGLFLVSMALGFSISNRMTRPLNTLAAFAKALPDSDFTSDKALCGAIEHLPGRHQDEVGRLAKALLFMEASLRDNIRCLMETTAANERMEGELSVAREIQLGLLPKTFPPFPNHSEFDLYASLEPAREVGGDLYDFFFMDEKHFCFAVGDVSGKGVPASLFMAISRTLLRSAAAREKDPARIMSTMNNDLASSNPNSMFVTLFIGVLDLDTGLLVYANGGHNPPVKISSGKLPEFMTGRSGPLVGAMEDMPYQTLEIQLEPDDTLFVYTDGVTEAMDTEQALYSDPRLVRTLSGTHGKSPREIIELIEKDVAAHVGRAEPSDDITMLCLRYAGIHPG